MKTSKEWAKILKVGGICLFDEKEPIKNWLIQVLDPDGWNRNDWQKSIDEKITIEEFKERIYASTCNWKGYEEFDKLINKVGIRLKKE